MTKIIIALIVAVALGIGSVVLFFSMKNDAPVPSDQPGGGTFPTPGTGGVVDGPNNVSDEPWEEVPGDDDSISLLSSRGNRLVVHDFIHNEITIPDRASKGDYVLAGPLGYCLPDGTCPQGAAVSGFRVSYSETYNGFTITLEEPLRANRQKAEDFMVATLGMDRRDLCELPYRIGTTSYINPVYAGQNLLFSFCPGAVALP